MNDYKGYSLFNDVEDVNLRDRNRAVILANIADIHSRDRRINAKGMSLILNYFNSIPMDERPELHRRFKNLMQDRGWVEKRA